MKKIFCLVSVFCLMLSCFSLSFAEEINSEGYVKETYLIKDGVMTKISDAELNNLLAESEEISAETVDQNDTTENNDTVENKVDSEIMRIVNPPYYEYFEKRHKEDVLRTDLKERISSYVKNKTSEDAERTISLSTTVSYSTEASLSSSVLDLIEGSIGGSIGQEISYSDEISVTIKPGKTVWYEFTPLMTRTSGTLRHYYDGIRSRDKSISVDFPQYKNRMADGILELREK